MRFLVMLPIWALMLFFFGATGGTMTACAQHPLANPDQALVIAKTEYVFEQTYNVAGNAYLARIKAGPWDAGQKAQAKALLQGAYSAVKLARQAQATGDAEGLAAQIEAVTVLVQRVRALTAVPVVVCVATMNPGHHPTDCKLDGSPVSTIVTGDVQ